MIPIDTQHKILVFWNPSKYEDVRNSPRVSRWAESKSPGWWTYISISASSEHYFDHRERKVYMISFE